MQTLNVLAGIAFDPTIRGLLSVGVGVVVLMGSVYLLLATNTGNRLGFLLASTGFWGWMAIMGIIWWIYGIGMVGVSPSWQVVEYNAANLDQAGTEAAQELDLRVLPQDVDGVDYDLIDDLAENDPAQLDIIDDALHDQTDWRLMRASNPARGEAEATVSAALPECSQCAFGIDDAGDFVVLGAFETGGKPRRDSNSVVDRVTNKLEQTFLYPTHPKHYAIVQVQKVIEQPLVPGEAPPLPVADPDEPVISVIMIRDIGDTRFPAAVITIASLAIFLLHCWILHQREQILEDNLEHAEKVSGGA